MVFVLPVVLVLVPVLLLQILPSITIPTPLIVWRCGPGPRLFPILARRGGVCINHAHTLSSIVKTGYRMRKASEAIL